MRGPEAKLYQKFKRLNPNIIWNRIENLSIPGMPAALGYNKNHFYFTVEFKVTKGNKVRLSPHQIAYHVAHPYHSFICVQHLGSGTVKLYEGSVVRELVACGLKLEPCSLGLEACSLYLAELGAWCLWLRPLMSTQKFWAMGTLLVPIHLFAVIVQF